MTTTRSLMESLQPGRYRHYKGQEYQVLGVARHSETEQPLVVYRALYGEFGLWVRPLAMFMESVQVNGQLQARFAFVTSDQQLATNDIGEPD